MMICAWETSCAAAHRTITSWFSINFFSLNIFSLTPLNSTIYSNLLILVVNIVCQTTYELNQIDRVVCVDSDSVDMEMRNSFN